LRRWIVGFEASSRSRARPRVVLVGAPNVGKSSLFNRLLGQARAIVSEVPGTTRDYVEAEAMVAGKRVMLVDTAGLREDTADGIEREGMSRSRGEVARADL